MSLENKLVLLQLIRQNNSLAFNQLVSQCWEQVYVYAFKLTGNQELSQSIVQNIFVDLWDRRESLEISNPDSYLFQAARFQVFKSYRDRKMKREVLQEKFEDYIQENESEFEPELIQKLHQSIDRLPEKRREIFRLNRFNELSVDQIADQLDLSRQTVKNQLTKAFNQLKADFRSN